MGQAVAFFGYIALILSLLIIFVVLAIRFVRAHERGAEALEEIARKFTGTGTGKGQDS